jgi:hypothetical protein
MLKGTKRNPQDVITVWGPGPAFATWEKIAHVIVFLVSLESSAITGTAIEAYGWSNPLFGPPPGGR